MGGSVEANIDYTTPFSWNRYAYANNDPVIGNDSTGQNFWDLASGLGFDLGDDGDGGGSSVSFFQAFLRKAMKQQRTPVNITLDAYAASHRAIADLKESGH